VIAQCNSAVAAVDRVPERARVQVVRELAVALRNTVGFDPARSGFDPVAGNHVIMQGAGVFAVFAHLAPGTVSGPPARRFGSGR
jgi:hypothetical protein